MSTTKDKGFLGWIENVGNKFPHPILLFSYITLATIVISFICYKAGVTVVHPSTGKDIAVVNLFSFATLGRLMTGFTANLQTFPVLATVLMLAAFSGLCEKTGFFSTAIKASLQNVKGHVVVFMIAFVGAIGNSAGDVAFLLVPTLGAGLFYGLKRNPVAGMFLGYAAVGGGYGANIIPGGWDVILTPIAVQAAKLVDPNFDMNLISGYFIMVTSTLLISSVATFVTVKIVEPRLGKYEGVPEGLENSDAAITPEEKKALKNSVLALAIALVLLVIACIPKTSFLRNAETGSLIFRSPLLSSINFLIMMMFFIPGITYGISMKKINNAKDLATYLTQAVAQVAGFVVLAIIIAQFLFLFNYSNLGTVLAISGGNLLKAINAPIPVIMVLFFILVAFANIFIISGSAKYLIFGPIFIPMLMQLNVHPAFTQMVYRMGDGVTNHLSPLNAFFVILLTLAQKYDKKIGMGTIFSVMIPYTIAFGIVYTIIILVWYFFNLPPGVDTTILLNP